MLFASGFHVLLRRGRDSNSRYLAALRFSRPVHSTSLPPLRAGILADCFLKIQSFFQFINNGILVRMKTTIFSIIGALLVGGIIGAFAFGNSGNKGEDLSVPESSDFLSIRTEIESISAQSISVEERSGLVYMREEEKLARDVYITLYEKWGQKIFSNISQSERTHTEAVRTLLLKYGIADPVSDDTVGVFENVELATLYSDLVAQGEASIEEAFIVGVTIEDLDIADLHKYIAQADNEDIVLVYENLMRGSRNHLRSFYSQLEAKGGAYEPQFMTTKEFNEVISSERERGSGGGGGGKGRGK